MNEYFCPFDVLQVWLLLAGSR